ncbi:MAG: outer membrane beta-barrel protein [Bacteroidota bacterium]
MKSIFSRMLLIFMLGQIMPFTWAQEERSDNLPVDRPRFFNLIFNRTFQISPTSEESPEAPINSLTSGNYFLGASFKTNFNHGSFGFRFQPGIAWQQLTYEQLDAKTFPTAPVDSISLDLERHRMTYLEIPIGIFVNITKDEDGDPLFHIEGGAYAGYLLNSAYKTKYQNKLGQEVKNVVREVPDLEDLRYGLYGRVGYKWLSLYYSYRLSDLFKEFPSRGSTANPIPGIPRMEFGILFIL